MGGVFVGIHILLAFSWLSDSHEGDDKIVSLGAAPLFCGSLLRAFNSLDISLDRRLSVYEGGGELQRAGVARPFIPWTGH